MTPRQLQQLVHETYAARHILNNLGFPDEELTIGAQSILNAQPPGRYATVMVRHGGLEFVMWTQPLRSGSDEDQFGQAWWRFIEAQPGMDRGELTRIVERTWMWKRKVELMTALLAKGFRFNGCSN